MEASTFPLSTVQWSADSTCTGSSRYSLLHLGRTHLHTFQVAIAPVREGLLETRLLRLSISMRWCMVQSVHHNAVLRMQLLDSNCDLLCSERKTTTGRLKRRLSSESRGIRWWRARIGEVWAEGG